MSGEAGVKEKPMDEDEKRVERAYTQVDAMKRIATILGTLPPDQCFAIIEWLRTLGAKNERGDLG